MTLEAEFEQWYQHFPRHTAKLDAKRAYLKARLKATAVELLDGIERYKRLKPAYADWCYPATWLNKGRWLDEDDRTGWGCPHDPPCTDGATKCSLRQRLGRVNL